MECGTSGGQNCRPASSRSSPRPQPSRFLFACPFRWSFVEEGNDTLARGCGRDEFIEVDLLCPGQPFVKVNRIPRVKGLLGVDERGRAQLAKFSQRPLDN